MGISQLQYTDNNSPRNIFIVGVGLYLVRRPCFQPPECLQLALRCCVSCCTARASCLKTARCPSVGLNRTIVSFHDCCSGFTVPTMSGVHGNAQQRLSRQM